MNELKPCPFCGGEAVLKQCNEIWFVLCTECPCAIIDLRIVTPDYARMLWNKRAERTCTNAGEGESRGGIPYFECSSCGFGCYRIERPNYCSNCGAKVMQ